MLKNIFEVAISSNEILTKTNSSELRFQVKNVKRKKTYGLFYRFIIGLVLILKVIFRKKSYLNKINKDKSVTGKIAVYSTLNQFKTIDKIVDETFSIYSLNNSIDEGIFISKYKLHSILIYILWYFILFFYVMYKKGVVNAVLLYSSCGERFPLAVLDYKFYIKFLQNKKVKSVLVANDHNYEIRSLILASKKLDIKRYYLQHGVVSDSFPDANVFTACFFDGHQALECYQRISKLECQYYLVGAVRFCIKSKINLSCIGNSVINIALNDTIDLAGIECMFKIVRAKMLKGMICKVRFHHMQSESDGIKKLCNTHDFIVEQTNMSVVDFLSKSRYLITVSSGIVLDALRIGVLPIIYIDHNSIDDFGYVEHSSALPLESLDFNNIDFKRKINEITQNGTYYDYLLNKGEFEYDKSIDLIKEILDSENIKNDGKSIKL
tara:strand:+ start:581 stop:1891 length:1311 start_codon:yes stop_codon:yes gene_type:complete